ncbi:unnamed protein product [Urochloa humidicola]
MAEVLAGLLTSAIVSIAKDKLAAAIAEQVNLLWNFGEDLEDMHSMLESISAALQDAERRSVKEKSVQLWLKRLRHAAIDISDLLEDYQDTSERLTAKVPYGMAITMTIGFYVKAKKLPNGRHMKRICSLTRTNGIMSLFLLMAATAEGKASSADEELRKSST